MTEQVNATQETPKALFLGLNLISKEVTIVLDDVHLEQLIATDSEIPQTLQGGFEVLSGISARNNDLLALVPTGDDLIKTIVKTDATIASAVLAGFGALAELSARSSAITIATLEELAEDAAITVDIELDDDEPETAPETETGTGDPADDNQGAA